MVKKVIKNWPLLATPPEKLDYLAAYDLYEVLYLKIMAGIKFYGDKIWRDEPWEVVRSDQGKGAKYNAPKRISKILTVKK